MITQKKEVEGFFNKIATGYKSKYTTSDAFLNYFFNERLVEATKGFDFKNKTILDIGTGTGNLYDYLHSQESSIDFYASDIAANMLDQSNIPADKRFVGLCYELNYPVEKFDYIFMLGVTTYLDENEIKKTFDFIYSTLNKDGKAIVTFTNQSSLDWKSRKLIKLLAKNLAPKKYVLSQEFTIFPKKLTEIEKRLKEQFEIEDVRWLNHTVFPLSQVIKKTSVKTAKKLHTSLKNKSLLNLLSSDFLLVLNKK